MPVVNIYVSFTTIEANYTFIMTYFNFITYMNTVIIIFNYNIVKYWLDFKLMAAIFNFK